ncbi:MAG: hypothetical protein V1848_00800 [Candidatus Magasanikbacteria bacterium]
MIFKKKEKEDKPVFSGRLLRPRFQQWFFRICFFVIIIILFIFILQRFGVYGKFLFYTNRILGVVLLIVFIVSFFERIFRKHVFLEQKNEDIELMFSNGENIIISNEWGIHIFEGINFYCFTKGENQYPLWFDVDEKKKFKRFLKENYIKTEKKKGFEYFFI